MINFSLHPLGDSALLIRFGNVIDPKINSYVHAATTYLQSAHLPGVYDFVAGYTSLTLHYDSLTWLEKEQLPIEALSACIVSLLTNFLVAPITTTGRLIEIPVCYGGEYGPDLEYVAHHVGLLPEEVIARHNGSEYRVNFLGFSPCFPYLSGLDPLLATPRRDTPRTDVASGSVGIGGIQTGIYPTQTPGGWQIIGRTPLRLFDPEATTPCYLACFDRLHFKPISEVDFTHFIKTKQ